MREKIFEMLKEADLLNSDVEKRQVSLGLMRIILQHANVVLAEEILRLRKTSPDVNFEREPLPLESLRAPSDGTLVSMLMQMLIAAENDGWRGISRPLFEEINSSRPSCIYSSSKKNNLENFLRGFVLSRNEGVEGHGLPGNYNAEADLDVISVALEKLAHILPVIDELGNLKYKAQDGSLQKVKLLKTQNGELICYRRIKKTNSGKCHVKAQVQVSLLKKNDYLYEATDILGTPDLGERPGYSEWTTYSEKWVPWAFFPDRLTESFVGRNDEIKELIDWADDLDSRACMLYGDGGIGKTTLAIEFVHRIAAGDLRPGWQPSLITFFSAKKTRWGISGLEHIHTGPANIADIAISIAKAFEKRDLDKSWYSCSPKTSIEKISGYLTEWGIKRNDHLLVLDNTETLITNEEELKELSVYIRELSRKVGRILLTSRRREPIEARQVEIKSLSTDESVTLLRKRAETLNSRAILQAGNATLNKYAEKLSNKPLVLEVFIQALGEPNMGLERAFDRVLRMQRQDLGEFLYQDAWDRMSNRIKALLLLMTRLGDFHDELLLKLCCSKANVTILEAEDALLESRGIANLTKTNGYLQISFSNDFMRFCEDRTVSIGNNKYPQQPTIDKIRRRYAEFVKSADRKVHDRVPKAYRHPLARAAYNAFHDGNFKDCELFYEEASLKDSKNGWLFDRYAYFLFTQQRWDEAYEKSKRATRLISEDADAWFTRGMIEARQGLTTEALISLTNAQNLGKPAHLCLLQKAYSYANSNLPDKYMAKKMLYESREQTPKSKINYNARHLDELNAFEIKLDNLY